MKILRPEILKCIKYNVPGKHGALDLVDDLFLMSFNVTDEEFNFICSKAHSEEIDMLIDSLSGAENSLQQFSNLKKAFLIRNRYLEIFSKNTVEKFEL